MIDTFRFPTKWDDFDKVKMFTRDDLAVCQKNIEVHGDILRITKYYRDFTGIHLVGGHLIKFGECITFNLKLVNNDNVPKRNRKIVRMKRTCSSGNDDICSGGSTA